MTNIIVIVILAVLVGGAAAYLVRAKRSGVKCVGCPAGGSCSSRKPSKKKLDGPVIGMKTVQISGMECAHCVMSVTENLNRINGVSAKVDLSKGNAVVSYDREIEDDMLKNAVEKAGFTVVSIHG